MDHIESELTRTGLGADTSLPSPNSTVTDAVVAMVVGAAPPLSQLFLGSLEERLDSGLDSPSVLRRREGSRRCRGWLASG